MGVSFVVIMMNARLLWVHDALLAGLHFQGRLGGSDVETQRRRLSIAHGRMERKKRRTRVKSKRTLNAK